jgi:signal transduction histidine kinase
VVRDNGPGITPKQIKDVTRPFYTTKKRGSGLGLSIVSNIIDEHRGSLSVRSAPGSGTEVSITLPTTAAG